MSGRENSHLLNINLHAENIACYETGNAEAKDSSKRIKEGFI